MNNEYFRPPIPGSQILVSGCVVRFSDPEGWPEIHANASHIAAGVESVGVDESSGWLEVIQSEMDAPSTPIIWAAANVDETLAQRGIILGPSGGTNRTRFAVHDTHLRRTLDLREESHRMRLQGENSNVWLSWGHVADAW